RASPSSGFISDQNASKSTNFPFAIVSLRYLRRPLERRRLARPGHFALPAGAVVAAATRRASREGRQELPAFARRLRDKAEPGQAIDVNFLGQLLAQLLAGVSVASCPVDKEHALQGNGNGPLSRQV